MENRKVDVQAIILAHEQNKKIKRAVLAFGDRKDMDPQRKIYSYLLKNTQGKTALLPTMNEINFYFKQNPQAKEKIQEALGIKAIADISNNLKNNIRAKVGPFMETINSFAESKGLSNKLHLISKKVRKPKNGFEEAIVKTLKSTGNASETLRVLGGLFQANTPIQIMKVTGVSANTLKKELGVREHMLIDKLDATMNYFADIEDAKIYGFKIAMAIIKGSLLALLMSTPLSAIGVGIIKFLVVVLIGIIITDKKVTASFLRKSGVAFGAIPLAVVKDLVRYFPFLKWKVEEVIPKMKGIFKKIFRRAAIEEIDYLLKSDVQFKRAYLSL